MRRIPGKPMGRRDWALLLIAALILLFWGGSGYFRRRGAVAQLHVAGDLVLEIPLDTAPDEIIDMREWGVPGKLEVKEGRVRFVEVTCPDHICEKTGFISKDGQSAVCMPNRAALTVIAED